MSHGNEVYLGGTGEGKSNALRERMRAYLADPFVSVCCLDPQPYSTAWGMFKDAIGLGQRHRCLFEDLSWCDAVLPRNWLLPSKATNQHQRDIDDKRTIELFLDPLARRRKFANFDEHPLLKAGGESWAGLMMHQDPRKLLADGIWALRPGTPGHSQLCLECRHPRFADYWRAIPKNPTALQQLCWPIERLLDPIFNSPAVRIRDGRGHGFDFHRWIDQGGHLFVQGGWNLSKEEQRFLLSQLCLDIIAYKDHGGRRYVVLVLEESEAFDLLGPHEVTALQTHRKNGLEIKATAQSPNWMKS